MFDLVDVPLYHGWLPDPQDSGYEVVKDLSYNQLVEMVINNSSSRDSNLVQDGMYLSTSGLCVFDKYCKTKVSDYISTVLQVPMYSKSEFNT